MQEMKHLAQWIEDSKSGIRKKEVKLIKEVPSIILAYKLVSGMQAAIYDHAPLTSTCGTIGKLVLLEFEDEDATMEKINVARVNVGYYLLNILFKNKKLQLRPGRTAREPYTVMVKDDEFIDKLLYSVNVDALNIKMHSRPIYDKPEQYTKLNHPILGAMVRKCNPDVKPYFTYENAPIVYDVINKHMRTPYMVNTYVLDVIKQCKQDPIFTFKGKDLEADARIGIKREQTGVLDMATSVGDRVFYQGMFYDFRGRLYSSMVYFSSQGSKLSKSLFYLKDKKPIGTEGHYWLFVHAANCWGQDKLSLDDGFDYTEAHLDEWLVWGEDPINNKGWQDADDPYGFLATIIEIYKAYQWKDGVYAFESGLLIAWDATCSGLQVLSALTRDKASGKLCNLTGEKRGDYYKMIADEVWKDCNYTEEDIVIANGISFDLNRMSKAITNASGRKDRKKAIEEIMLFMSENRDDIRIATKVYWGRPEMAELRRRIVKRPCMTYFYSCQPKTMSKQLFNDFKSEPEFKGLQMSYCYWLCNRIYKACREKMPKATKMMDALIQMGIKDFKDGDDFTMIAPYTKFKLMQYYRNTIKKNVIVVYNGKEIRIKVMVGKDGNVKYTKVKSATSPNVVHMLDSQIVAAIIMNASYDINVIHDSFSTCPADAGKLWEDCRTCFVDLFDIDLLQRMLDEKNFECDIELGDLNIDDVLDNEYTFK